jgi:hypothetical protein
MAGAFANSLLFIGSLIGFTMLAAGILAYTAHCVVIVLSETAAGTDQVRWPGELFIDWIGQAIRFFGVVAIVLMPVGFLLRALGDQFLPDEPALRILVLVVPWLWLTFPIALLSSMSAGSLFVVFRPTMVRDLFRVFRSTLFFYFMSAVGICGLLTVWYGALLTGNAWFIPFAAILTSAGLLIYARLLGRIAWLTAELEEPQPRRKTKAKSKAAKKVSVSDPWAAPAEGVEEVEADKLADAANAPLTGYEVTNQPSARTAELKLAMGSPLLDVKSTSITAPAGDLPALTAPRLSEAIAKATAKFNGAAPPSVRLDTVASEDDSRPLQMLPEEPLPETGKPATEEIAPAPLEKRSRRPVDVEPLPEYPLFSGVYNFPLYITSLRAFCALSFSWFLLGCGVELLIVLFPY